MSPKELRINIASEPEMVNPDVEGDSDTNGWLPVRRHRGAMEKRKCKPRGILKKRIVGGHCRDAGVEEGNNGVWEVSQILNSQQKIAHRNRWELLDADRDKVTGDSLQGDLLPDAKKLRERSDTGEDTRSDTLDIGDSDLSTLLERDVVSNRAKSANNVSFNNKVLFKFFDIKKNSFAVTKSKERRWRTKDDRQKCRELDRKRRKTTGEYTPVRSSGWRGESSGMISTADTEAQLNEELVARLLVDNNASSADMDVADSEVNVIKVNCSEWWKSCDVDVIKSNVIIFSEIANEGKAVMMNQQHYVCDMEGCELSFASKKEWSDHNQIHAGKTVKSPGVEKDFMPEGTDTSTQQVPVVTEPPVKSDGESEEMDTQDTQEDLDSTRMPKVVSGGYRADETLQDDTRHLCPPGQGHMPDNTGKSTDTNESVKIDKYISYAAAVSGTADDLMNSVMEKVNQGERGKDVKQTKKRKVKEAELEESVSVCSTPESSQARKKLGRPKMTEEQKLNSANKRSAEKSKAKQLADKAKQRALASKTRAAQTTVASRNKARPTLNVSKGGKDSLRLVSQQAFAKKQKEKQEMMDKAAAELGFPKGITNPDGSRYTIPKQGEFDESLGNEETEDPGLSLSGGEREELIALVDTAEKNAEQWEGRAKKAEEAQTLLQSEIDEMTVRIDRYVEEHAELMLKEDDQGKEIISLKLNLTRAKKTVQELEEKAEESAVIDQELGKIVAGIGPGEHEKLKTQIAEKIQEYQRKIRNLEDSLQLSEKQKSFQEKNVDTLAACLADRNNAVAEETKKVMARDRLILVLNKKIPCEKLARGEKCNGSTCGQKHSNDKVAERNRSRVNPCKYYWGLGEDHCKPPGGQGTCNYSHEEPEDDKDMLAEYRKMVRQYTLDFANNKPDGNKSGKKNEGGKTKTNTASKSINKPNNRTNNKPGKRSGKKGNGGTDNKANKTPKQGGSGGNQGGSFMETPEGGRGDDHGLQVVTKKQILDELLQSCEDGYMSEASGNENGSVRAESITSETHSSASVLSAAKKRRVADQVYASDKFQSRLMSPKMGTAGQTPSSSPAASSLSTATSMEEIKRLMKSHSSLRK